jgi:hypothetical protein
VKNKDTIEEKNRSHKAFIRKLERCYDRLSALTEVSIKYRDNYSSTKNVKIDEDSQDKNIETISKNVFENFIKFNINDVDDGKLKTSTINWNALLKMKLSIS